MASDELQLLKRQLKLAVAEKVGLEADQETLRAQLQERAAKPYAGGTVMQSDDSAVATQLLSAQAEIARLNQELVQARTAPATSVDSGSSANSLENDLREVSCLASPPSLHRTRANVPRLRAAARDAASAMSVCVREACCSAASLEASPCTDASK